MCVIHISIFHPFVTDPDRTQIPWMADQKGYSKVKILLLVFMTFKDKLGMILMVIQGRGAVVVVTSSTCLLHVGSE